jgi:hypothetical protein
MLKAISLHALASVMAVVLAVLGTCTAHATGNQEGHTMRIAIHVGGTTLNGTLEDNATARDFAALLPMTLTLTDYAATEKVSDLPKKLSTQGAPKGFDPDVGDITYYAPWGNLAVFHKDFGFSTGLVNLGRIESGIDTLRRPGPLQATVELLQP